MNPPICTAVLRRVLPLTTLALSLSAITAPVARATTTPDLIDDFSDALRTRTGAGRMLIDDRTMGSHSHATEKCEKGVLVVEGDLVPGRGLPAFVSLPLLLAPDAQPQDVTGYQGVRVRIKILKGIVAVQVASADIHNFDYHTSSPVAAKHGVFAEVRIPFQEMKRGWSEQAALNLKAITGVNLVAFGMAPDAFSYEVDEIGFY